MKHLHLIILGLLLVFYLPAQIPSSFKYQAIVRDNQGNFLESKEISIQVSIFSGSSSGSLVFRERHFLTSGMHGEANLSIGNGNPVIGKIKDIKWAEHEYFLQLAIDITGGNSYTTIGTSQILSVPFALYANEAGNGFSGNYQDLSNKPDLSSFLTSEKDADPKNEIQYLSINHDSLILSKGNSISLKSLSTGNSFAAFNYYGRGKNGKFSSHGPLTLSGTMDFENFTLNTYDTLTLGSETVMIRVKDTCIINGFIVGSGVCSASSKGLGGTGGGGGGIYSNESGSLRKGETPVSISYLRGPFLGYAEMKGGEGGIISNLAGDNLNGKPGASFDTSSLQDMLAMNPFFSISGSPGGSGGGDYPGCDTTVIHGGAGGGGLYIWAKYLIFKGNIDLHGAFGAPGINLAVNCNSLSGTSATGGGGGGGGGSLIMRCNELIENSGIINVDGGEGGNGATGSFYDNINSKTHISAGGKGGTGGQGWYIIIQN